MRNAVPNVTDVVHVTDVVYAKRSSNLVHVYICKQLKSTNLLICLHCFTIGCQGDVMSMFKNIVTVCVVYL